MSNGSGPAGLAPTRFGGMVRWFREANGADLLSARGHSEDFNQVRASRVFQRIRVLALALALAAPLWLPVDWLFLEGERFRAFLGLRLGWIAAFAGLALWGAGRNRLDLMRLRIGVLVGVPVLFFAGSRMALEGGTPSAGVLMGYAFLPLLIAALLAIFPLTLREGLGYAALLALPVAGMDLAFGTLLDILRLRDLWLLALLLMVALWGQVSQMGLLLRLHREATRDPLTGLMNRRVLIRTLDREVAASRAGGWPLSVLLFDLDQFERINDTHGHIIGDRVLGHFAAVLEGHLPEGAVPGRYGGEVFMAVLPGWKRDAARERAEAIRRTWEATEVVGSDGKALQLSVSVGAATLRHEDHNAETLVARVDEGLYEAKETGGNRVVTTG
ncbi:GGDEF domain-containing protein [Thiohalorhabdus sp.]|uniref:GGDEF domain-containing protein n=1 Tax=Thiohalorhabdus sp. TaxID=3094134 RepID=UPI002FC38C59